MSERDDLRKGWRECMMLGPSDPLWNVAVEKAKARAADANRDMARYLSVGATMDDTPVQMEHARLMPGQQVVDSRTILAAEARIKELESRLAWLDERGVLREATRRYAAEMADMLARRSKNRGEA